MIWPALIMSSLPVVFIGLLMMGCFDPPKVIRAKKRSKSAWLAERRLANHRLAERRLANRRKHK